MGPFSIPDGMSMDPICAGFVQVTTAVMNHRSTIIFEKSSLTEYRTLYSASPPGDLSNSGCGGVNKFGSLRFMYLNAWPTESGTIRRCGLNGGGVALLKVCHHGDRALSSPMLKFYPT